MTLERFEDLLDLYGPNLADWPEQHRSSAQELLASSETARDWLADANLMVSALDSYEVDAPSAQLEASLLDLAPKAPARQVRRSEGFLSWIDLRIFSTAGAALACAAFGLVIGLNAIQPSETATDEADLFVTAALTTYDTNFWEGDEG